MDKILLEPRILENKKEIENLAQDLNDEVENFKPYILKDVLLLSPGIWNNKLFSKDSIVNGYYRTDWSNKENYALIYEHDARAENWVGNAINRRVTEEGKLYGDLELYDRELAIKLGKGKAKLGISAKVLGELTGDGEFKINTFGNFSIVYNPACKDAFINLAEGGIVTSSTSQGSQVGNSHVNREIDYGEEEEEDIDTKKKGDKNREKMEKEEVTKVELNQSEELNSKLDSVLEAVMKLSERMDALEKPEEEVVEEEVVAEEEKKEEVVAEKESPVKEEEKEEAVSEDLSKEEKEEEVKEEVVEDKKEEENLSSQLEEANAKIALLQAEKSKSEPKTFVELSKESLGPGARDFDNMEMNLLNTLNKNI